MRQSQIQTCVGPASQGLDTGGLVDYFRANRARTPRTRLQWALATSLAAAWIRLVTSSGPWLSSQATSIPPTASGTGTLETSCSLSVPTRQSSLTCVPSRSIARTGTSRRSTFHDVMRRRRRGDRHASTASAPNPKVVPTDSTETLTYKASSSKDGDSRRMHQNAQRTSDLADLNKMHDINALMRHPVLLDNVKAPRYPIVLCHGLYGFNVRGPFWGLEIHYWANVLDILRKKIGAEVIVHGVPGTGAIADRAQALHDFLKTPKSGCRGKPLNFVGHSMGGLDARYLISVIEPAPEEYIPLSLTTLNAPHRGSPFMDWCNANVGTGNERVEREIHEARSKGWPRSSMDGAKSAMRSESRASQSIDKEEDFSRHVVEKPPFSLKTPLFVRPDKSKKDLSSVKDNKEDDDVKTMAKGTVAVVAEEATSTTGKNNYEAAKKRGSGGGSLLDFSAFKRALSSISGTFSSYMLSILDQPAYAMLSTKYMAYVFNPMVNDSPNVEYFSIASRKRNLPVYHPLWLPKQILDAAAESRSLGGERDGSGDAVGGRLEGNDGLVSVESARWGTFLGVVDGCDHWDLRGGGAPRWAARAAQAANNKNLKEQIDKSAEKEDVKATEAGKNSWIDVNRIIGQLATKRGDQTSDGSPSSLSSEQRSKNSKAGSDDATESANDNSDNLVDEVATWISDRLPQKNSAQNAQIDHSSQKRQESVAKAVQEEKKPGDADADTQTQAAHTSNMSSVKHAYVPSSEELADMRLQVKLRREAAWQEELGHDERARELRRELAWHRAERDREASQAAAGSGVTRRSSVPRELDWDAYVKERPDDKRATNNKKSNGFSSADDLERFWIALCRHLWVRGY